MCLIWDEKDNNPEVEVAVSEATLLFSYVYVFINFRETSHDCNRIHGKWSPRCISQGK